MKRITRIVCVSFMVVVIISIMSGCFSTYPIYETVRSEGEDRYVEVEGTRYFIWPDKNWEMLLESSTKIGNWDDRRTSLRVFEEDDEMRYLSVGELGATTLHVPLVREDLVKEFSIEQIDLIKWLGWGIYTGESEEKIEYIIDDTQKVRRFIELIGSGEEETGNEEWEQIAALYCYNNKLPGVEYVVYVKYFSGVIKLESSYTADYNLMTLDDFEGFLGYNLEVE